MNKKITTAMLSVATGATLLAGLVAIPADAQSVGTAATVSAKAGANTAARLAKIISKSDTAITKRITDLNTLNTKVQAMKNVSSTEKANITSEVQTNVSGLTSLKAKIDADTDATTAASDAKQITGSYRIYALVIPQGYIEVASDRIDTIVGMLNTVSAKLQLRISQDQSAGKNVSALQASLSDLNAKLADAKSQASTAVSGVTSLVPDQGNQTQLQSNTAALKSARADTKTGTSDLKTARDDAKSILQGLKSLGGNGSVSASSSVTAQ